MEGLHHNNGKWMEKKTANEIQTGTIWWAGDLGFENIPSWS